MYRSYPKRNSPRAEYTYTEHKQPWPELVVGHTRAFYSFGRYLLDGLHLRDDVTAIARWVKLP